MHAIGLAGASLAMSLLCLVDPSVGRAEGLKQSATSTIQMEITTTPDGPEATAHQTRAWFMFAHANFGWDERIVLLRNEVLSTTQPSGMEYVTDIDRATISASVVDAAGADQRLYALSFEGVSDSDIDIWVGYDQLAVAVGNPDIWNWRIHDLATGKFLLLSHASWGASSVHVEGDCERKRFAAVAHAYDLDLDWGGAYPGRLVAGVTYASPDGPIARAILSVDDAHDASSLHGTGPFKADLLRLESSESRGTVRALGDDRSTFTDLLIRIRLPNNALVEIPVIADTLDFAHATLPKGFVLTLVQ